MITSAHPSPSTSAAETSTPPVNDASNVNVLSRVAPVVPSNTITRGPPPAPAAATTSGVPSPLTSPAATLTADAPSNGVNPWIAVPSE